MFLLSYSIILGIDLYNSDQAINDKIVEHINDVLIKFKKIYL